MNEPQRILFSGYTASRKTTYSKLIAAEFERPWFDATTILKTLGGLAHIENGALWNTEAASQMQAAREGDAIDRETDKILLRKTQETTGAVVDAWALPWLWQGDAVRVFVKADLDTRVQRCIGSRFASPDMTAKDAEKLITEKDNYSRELFLRLYGFDLFEDHSIFDVVLDTSGYIPDKPGLRGVDAATKKILPAARLAILHAATPSLA